ncbi:hypothetical protein QYE76_036092 [Lolium multiflorum]|uniref:Uncharacterized protein n=1 Tax=Lolium multiflorum TaxID=4521 RepID=A0AAD8R3T6_LOLMU|nr:hypothetical protein QYE76_036092 [Lolium multiflorum]
MAVTVSRPQGFPWPINRWRTSPCTPCSPPPLHCCSDTLYLCTHPLSVAGVEDEADGGGHPSLRRVVQEERLDSRSIWEEPSIQGSRVEDQSRRSLLQHIAGKSPIAVVSVDHRRSRPHLELQGEHTRLSHLLSLPGIACSPNSHVGRSSTAAVPIAGEAPSSPELLELRARARRSPQKLCVDWSLPELHNCTSRFLIDHHFPTHIARDLQRPGKLSDPLLALWMDPIIPTEPFLQTQVYDLANGGDLIFERDLFALTDFLGRTPPVFYGGQISDNGQLQWLIMANLPGKPESPMFRQIQFSLRENTWVDGLAHALQESLARLCGQNSLAIEGERFAHFARHSSVGLPLSLPYHPVLRHHVDHLDYMLYETRSALSDSRSAANHTQQQLNQYAETIKVIAKERRTLRQLVAKRDATIHRLKTKIAVLKETISTQVEQLQILEGEGEGEDIQGDGYSYVSNDNDYEPEEEGDDDFHHHCLPGWTPPSRSASMDSFHPLLEHRVA